MMAKKRTMIFVLTVVCMFSLMITTSCKGCFGDENTSSGITVEQDTYNVEYGESFIVPEATHQNGGTLDDGTITAKAYDADGNEIAIDYGTCFFEKGTNKIIYTATDGAVKEITVICADTKAPTVTLANFVPATFVGDKYKLPSYTETDISGVDVSASKIQLFKEDATTAVAEGKGAEVTIEEAKYYMLKVTSKDNDGNQETYEYRINIINVFKDTNLADNMMFDFDENDYLQNIISGADSKQFNKEIVANYPEATGTIRPEGGALKLTLTEDGPASAYIYKGRKAEKAETFSIKVRTYLNEKVEYIYFKDVASGVVVRAFTLTDFTSCEWIDLEIKMNAFNAESIDSLFVEIGGESGAIVYIDQVEIVPVYVDKNRDENILLDYDEKDIYGHWQTTFADSELNIDVENTVLSILTEEDEELPEGAHGGVLKISPSADGLHTSIFTWLFEEYISISEIDGITFRIYLTEEFIRNNQIIYVSCCDYNKRAVTGYWLINNITRSKKPWTAGWNEFTLYTNDLRGDGASGGQNLSGVIHGFSFVFGDQRWGEKGGTVYLDEIRKVPLGYVDGDLDPWSEYMTFDKDEYVNGEYGRLPAVRPDKNSTVSIESISGANGKALKMVTSVNGAAVRLFNGPNNVIELSNHDASLINGAKIRVYSEKSNSLKLVGYDRRDGVNAGFTLSLSKGWNEFDLNYFTNEYGVGCDIYYFDAILTDAGTIYIDQISKTDNVGIKYAQNNDKVFYAKEETAKYSIEYQVDHGWGSNYSAFASVLSYVDKDPNGDDTNGISIAHDVAVGGNTYRKYNVVFNKPVKYNSLGILRIRLYVQDALGVYVWNTENKTEMLHESAVSGNNKWVNLDVPLSMIANDGDTLDSFYLGFATASDCIVDGILESVTYIDSLEWVDVEITGGSIVSGCFNGKAIKGTTIMLEHDQSLIPEGKTFAGWLVNDKLVVGDSITITENTVISACYEDIITELDIPDGAIMVCDNSTDTNPWRWPNWGSNMGVDETNWLSVYADRAGVQCFSTVSETGNYDLYTSVGMQSISVSFDLSKMEKITFRLKINPSNCKGILLKPDNEDLKELTHWLVDNTGKEYTSSDWFEVSYKIADLGITDWSKDYSFYFQILSFGKGDICWVDQIYLTPKKTAEYNIKIYVDGVDVTEANKEKITEICGETKAYVGDMIDITAAAIAMTPQGFALDRTNSVLTGVVKEDGSLVLSANYITPKNMFTVNLTNATMQGIEGNQVAEGTEITLIPKVGDGQYFAGWTVNGEAYDGNTIIVDKDLTIVAIVLDLPEEVIPEGSTALNQYTEKTSLWHRTNWGSSGGYSEWLEVYDGVRGVVKFGNSDGGETYNHFALNIKNVDLTKYSEIVVRLKVDPAKCRFVWIWLGSSGKEIDVLEAGKTHPSGWLEIKIPVAGMLELSTDQTAEEFHIQYGTLKGSAAGDCIWLDGIYAK